jgi:hypothetical protein
MDCKHGRSVLESCEPCARLVEGPAVQTRELGEPFARCAHGVDRDRVLCIACEDERRERDFARGYAQSIADIRVMLERVGAQSDRATREAMGVTAHALAMWDEKAVAESIARGESPIAGVMMDIGTRHFAHVGIGRAKA